MDEERFAAQILLAVCAKTLRAPRCLGFGADGIAARLRLYLGIGARGGLPSRQGDDLSPQSGSCCLGTRPSSYRTSEYSSQVSPCDPADLSNSLISAVLRKCENSNSPDFSFFIACLDPDRPTS